MPLIGKVRRLFATPGQTAPSAIPCYGERREAELRADATAILAAALASAEPASAVERSLRDAPPALADNTRIHVIALGKAAAAMGRGAAAVLGDRIASGIIVVPPGFPTASPEPLRRLVGGHPVPDARSIEAGKSLVATIDAAGPDDLILVLLSGGGSSVATVPHDGLAIDDVADVIGRLHEAGATSEERSIVLRRLDRLKAGGLARLASGRRVLSLVVSDLPGASVDAVASAPVSPDPTKITRVQAVLKTRGVWSRLPLAVRGHLEMAIAGEVAETPKAKDRLFANVESRVVASSATAADAALAEAGRRGYHSQLLSAELVGDAREAGTLIGEMARSLASTRQPGKPPQCVVAFGETTTLGAGETGGRHPELAIGSAIEMEGIEGALLLSTGTDGADNDRGSAGVVVTGETAARAREAGIDLMSTTGPAAAFDALNALRDVVVTGPTGTHVGDALVLLLG